MSRTGIALVAAFTLLGAGIASAKPRPSVAVYVVKAASGKCTTDISYSRLIYSDNKSSARIIARRECTQKHGRKNCSVESYRSGDTPPTHLAIVKSSVDCYDGQPRNTFGIGVGMSDAEANESANKHLGRRNWTWSAKKHGSEQVTSLSLGWSNASETLDCEGKFPDVAFETIVRNVSGSSPSHRQLVALRWKTPDGVTSTTSIKALLGLEKERQAEKKRTREMGKTKLVSPVAIDFPDGRSISFATLYSTLCKCNTSTCSNTPLKPTSRTLGIMNALKKKLAKKVGPILKAWCIAEKGEEACKAKPTKDAQLGVRG